MGGLSGLTFGLTPITTVGLTVGDLTSNIVFMSAVYSWFAAQILKARAAPGPGVCSEMHVNLRSTQGAALLMPTFGHERVQTCNARELQPGAPGTSVLPIIPPLRPPQIFTKYARTRSWDWRVLVRSQPKHQTPYLPLAVSILLQSHHL